MGFFSLLSVRTWAVLGAAVALAGILGWGVMAIRGGGVASCEQRHLVADAKAAEMAHQQYLAQVAKGDALAAKLADTERQLNDTKTEYMAYANGITGKCPASVGVLANAAARSVRLPQAASKPADPATAAGPIAASTLAENIAENYGRANACISQLNLLIDWHAQVVSPQ